MNFKMVLVYLRNLVIDFVHFTILKRNSLHSKITSREISLKKKRKDLSSYKQTRKDIHHE